MIVTRYGLAVTVALSLTSMALDASVHIFVGVHIRYAVRSCGQRPESHLVRLGTGGCPSMDSAVVSAAPHSHQLSQHARSPQTVKVVILAGGLGTRLAEETELKPK